ncbi:cytochrome oxidase maturation protein, cbb3-type [Magnetococcus marinus MC-1]|uniref:Cytochrome oxidase maturation protein, cbb3-type n=1 Tax=Magnetococcus marinus (strain ATCC BAA-1437 / JCM 17883 / MC-1) TaxID=156889 RepID=A0LA66_MAGMM|nr:cbb3-type cytochrome oxidase assembly protein CcoS [Magnetococcus marinus]ABK44859.1 cytochrome oxidase maturation protein, cbb3-type [Magnetococcus marinus MC-1]
MEVIFILLPLGIFIALGFLGLMIWSWKQGQFDDLEGPAHRILYDDDQDMIPRADEKAKKGTIEPK